MFFFYQKHNSTIHGILELTKMSILSYHLQKIYLTEILKKKHFITIYLDTPGIHLPENILSEYIHGNILICSEGINFSILYIYIYHCNLYAFFNLLYEKKYPHKLYLCDNFNTNVIKAKLVLLQTFFVK